MKKSLIALAALAATASFAQSTVEIYGGLDVGLGQVKGGQVGVNNTSYIFPASQAATGLANAFTRNGLTANFIGFRGTEDLGGGMKAFFDLQSANMDMSTGSTALTFNRESALGLSGSFGSLKLGRSVSTMCSVGCGFDMNMIGAGNANALNGLSAASVNSSSRRSNQIELTLPTMAGVTARVATIMKGDAVEDSTFNNALGSTAAAAGTNNAFLNYKAVYALGLNYANGPLRAAYALETANSDSAARRNAQFAAVDYDFGVVKAVASYTVNGTIGGNFAGGTNVAAKNYIGYTNLSSTAGTSTGKGYGFGLSAPIGAATVGVQWSNNTENQTKATELFARYAMSKRTQLYTYYTVTSGVAAAGNTALISGTTAVTAPTVTNNINAYGVSVIPVNPTVFGLGVRHSF